MKLAPSYHHSLNLKSIILKLNVFYETKTCPYERIWHVIYDRNYCSNQRNPTLQIKFHIIYIIEPLANKRAYVCLSLAPKIVKIFFLYCWLFLTMTNMVLWFITFCNKLLSILTRNLRRRCTCVFNCMKKIF